jgi:serine protease Do
MRGFGEIGERLRRSTVQVHVGGRGGGSGVVWTGNGIVVTNAHVARGEAAEVELWDGTRLKAEVAKRDARRDLAVLRVGASGLEAAEAGDSNAVQAGQIAIAIGNPLGFAGALSTGVVHSVGPISGMGRERWIRADVRLAPGNSGGPLANAQGRVIGINTAIVSGLGVAVPSNVAALFVAAGPRPSIGVTLEPEGNGLRVLRVERSGAAEAASIRAGDLLVGSYDDLIDQLESGNASITLQFLRGARLHRVEIPLAKRAQAA